MPIATSKTVNLDEDTVVEIEEICSTPGQNFKWDPFLRWLCETYLEKEKAKWRAKEGK